MLVFFILFFFGAALSCMGLIVWHQSNLILPGLTVMDTLVGGLSSAEAAPVVREVWHRQSITLSAGQERWVVTAGKLGMVIDEWSTVEQARATGRSMESLESLVRDRRLPGIAPVWRFELAIAETSLQDLASLIDIAAVDAGVHIRDGQAQATPSVTGRRLDVHATLATLARDPAAILNNGYLSLVIEPVAPSLVDTSQAVEAANQLLGRTVIVRIFDPISGETGDRTIAPQVWGNWLALQADDPATGQFSWLIDRQKLEAYLTQESQALGQGRYIDVGEAASALSDAIQDQAAGATWRIYHQERQHTVQPGETLSSIGRAYGIPYPWISQANPGLGDSLFAGQTITIPSPDAMLPLPVVADKRVVVSLSQQRTWVYENGNLIWEWPSSTGIDESPTAPGVFQIQSHEPNAYASIWDLWMPNFMGVYRPVPTSDFMNGFHGFPTRSGANLLWTGDLGRQVTYGCILLSSENAATLYNWAEDGVVVDIQP